MATFAAASLVALAILASFGCGSWLARVTGPPTHPPLSADAVAEACNAAESQLHPFVVAWDELSDFESHARQGTVLVHVEGCAIEPLYACADAHFGGYAPAEQVTSVLEVLDIKTEDDLYAKLPIGAATLAERVQAGRVVRLRYVIGGTITATRPALYQGELKGLNACATATHFIAAYDVGAFAISAIDPSAASVDATDGGATVEGNGAELRAGGTLSSCQGDDRSQCLVPLRLTLRKIAPGAGSPP